LYLFYYREVFKAKDKKTNKKFVAMKKVLMDNEKEGVSLFYIMWSLRLLRLIFCTSNFLLNLCVNPTRTTLILLFYLTKIYTNYNLQFVFLHTHTHTHKHIFFLLQFPITALREIKILQLLKHENVVNLIEICRTRGKYIFYSLYIF